MANGHEDFNPLGQRIFWGVAIALITATLLVFSGEGGLTALQSTIILVGLPFFVMGYFQMYALLRALKEDAGELPPRSEEHTSELQSRGHLVCRLLLEKKNDKHTT